MNPWLAQNLSASRRDDMFRAATQRRLARECRPGGARQVAGNWLISAGQRLSGVDRSTRVSTLAPAIR
jgi:hypothetical protein